MVQNPFQGTVNKLLPNGNGHFVPIFGTDKNSISTIFGKMKSVNYGCTDAIWSTVYAYGKQKFTFPDIGFRSPIPVIYPKCENANSCWHLNTYKQDGLLAQLSLENSLYQNDNISVTEENEERSMIEPNSRDQPKVKELMKVCTDYILANQ